MIDKGDKLSIRTQCKLLKLARSRIYYKIQKKNDAELEDKIACIYKSFPVYGYRRVTACLRREGLLINKKRTLKVMQQMGLQAIYPKPKTPLRNKAHKKYPYALRNMVITRPHQVWQIDITYLRTNHGFIYLNALIDVHSRYVVGWSLSTSLDTEGCLRTLESSILAHGVPDIINSDQGCQFTGEDWERALHGHSILISHSGRGRSNDNAYVERLWRTLKYEWSYIKGARTVSDYKELIPLFISWYNDLRPHQALSYRTPSEALREEAYGYVDKALALPHIPTSPQAQHQQQQM